MSVKEKMKSNIWKLMLIKLTHKRYYLTLLSIYFLTLPDATAQQIGLWAGIAYITESLFELPSGYISDRIGHRKMLIFSKVSMLLAVTVLIFATSIYSFIIAALLTSLAWASLSGTHTAFLHNTVEALGKEKEFTKINMRQQSYAALFGATLFIAVPFLVNISIRAPFMLSLFIDVVGLLIAFSLVNPPAQDYKDADPVPLWSIVGDLWRAQFFPVAIFATGIAGAILASNRFIFPYLEVLGMSVKYMGFIVAAVGVLQFAFVHFIGNKIQKISLSHIFLLDILLFVPLFIIIALTGNYWLVAVLVIVRESYKKIRKPFLESYVLENYVNDKRYKATVLSVLGQVRILMAAVTVFAISPVMGISYEAGFIVFAVVIFVLLTTTFAYIKLNKVLFVASKSGA